MQVKYLIVSLFFFFTNFQLVQSQSQVSINFVPVFGNTRLSIDETFHKISDEDSVQIEALKFYISKVELWDAQHVVYAEEHSFHLLDAAETGSLMLKLNVPPNTVFSQLKFNIGIDSLTNVSGAFGGDLDPTNGMYWTWQSGYINFKLEGVATNCPVRNNRFQFHIGGYQYPFNSLQTIDLEMPGDSDIEVRIAVDQLIAQLNLPETAQVMSPNQSAVDFAKMLPAIFSVSQ